MSVSLSTKRFKLTQGSYRAHSLTKSQGKTIISPHPEGEKVRIILTGGAGFIGSWVCEAYISEGHEVLVIDNLSTGSEDNIPPEAEFIECDVRDCTGLEKAFRQFRPEVVNHHAAQINVRDSVEDPSFDAEVNIGGSLNVLRLCVGHKTEKFIFSSTGGALYGEPEKLPADELTPTLPLSPYGISKLATENYVRYHSKNHGFGHVILRYANVYGERQNPEGEAGVIGIFCENILSENIRKSPGNLLAANPCLESSVYSETEKNRRGRSSDTCMSLTSPAFMANLLAAMWTLGLKEEGTFNIGTGGIRL